MKADPTWPAPTGIRLERARVACDAHARGLWGKPSSFDIGGPSWVQEIWAQVADAALGDSDPIKAGQLAYNKRIELEDRIRFGESWESLGSLGWIIWTNVAVAVRELANGQS